MTEVPFNATRNPMKELPLEQFSQQTQACVQAAQQEQLLITQNGKPVALVVGLENKDAEDWQLQTSPDFWRMIEERRQRPTIPLAEVEAELLSG